MLPEDTTMYDVAQWLRAKFPDAVSVRLFVALAAAYDKEDAFLRRLSYRNSLRQQS